MQREATAHESQSFGSVGPSITVGVRGLSTRMALAVVLGVYYTVQRRGIISSSHEWFVSRGM